MSGNHISAIKQESFNDDSISSMEQEMKPMEIRDSISDSSSSHQPYCNKIKLLSFAVFLLSLVLAVDIFDKYQHKLQKHDSFSRSSYNQDNGEETLTTATNEMNDDDARKYTILPKKIYSVIGLEDSGTTFTTSILQKALHLKATRQGSFPCGNTRCNEKDEVQVQHFSLPWGSVCQGKTETVDVVLPSACTRTHVRQDTILQCSQMTQDVWGFESNTSRPIKYPSRYNLDIVKHKEWYERQGVEQYFILVVRDQSISATARSKGHCTNPILLKQEEEAGTEILVEAINKYFLEKDEQVTKHTFPTWAAEQFQINAAKVEAAKNKKNGHRQLSLLPFKNNVVLVSYESLMKLGPVYVQMLYDTLGIETDYMPQIKDGNQKYVTKPVEDKKKSKNAGNTKVFGKGHV
ncbi:hypothetical protein CTEN210_02716 [Chaetoceros tenuissimus]|uniref:Sulfotransferase n=1 Tax=Chaetoceros tenuissimus TaxID=426638 RepID=A0AAD3CHJ6_9STRA|nr:hypothetical protein CTEN210_02716 [Chaetoceros tenuissimus]